MTDNKIHSATLIMDDISPIFIKLAKRLQQLSKFSANGLSVINLSIFLIDGEPVQWTRPDINNMATLEPKGNSDTLLDMLKKLHK